MNLLICDALVEHYFTERPRQVQIADKYGLTPVQVFRQLKKVSDCLNGLLIRTRFKLDADFRACGIICQTERLEA